MADFRAMRIIPIMESVNALDLFDSNYLKAAVVAKHQRARSGCWFENHAEASGLLNYGSSASTGGAQIQYRLS